jgi:hypothetical protein
MKKALLVPVLLFILSFSSCKKSDGLNSVKAEEQDAAVNSEIIDFQKRNVDSLAIKAMDVENETQMTFATTDFDFGTIKSGDVVTYAFKFTNTGTKNLVIKDAKVSCGCTVTNYPKEPIAPGKTSEISIRFDSARKSGRQLKSINVYGNIPNGKQILYIRATIKA